MSDDGGLWLLLAGPASGTGLYWFLYRYYRNTDKSHAFEHETAVEAKPVTGTDQKIDAIKGTRETHIRGNNVSDYRTRVQRNRDGAAAPPGAAPPRPPGTNGKKT